MSEKKTLHIIPHSHWDREWYLPFETHRTRLVKLFDTLIELMENNPDYTYYHMDGQFVVIEDYLEIRPDRKDRLLALIKADRIQVGPWYILQDEYLTSGEANIRNMLYGIKLCKNFGAEPVMTGYFPDAFGNISQAPQILRGFGIDNAVFGRGLNDIGSDNQVVRQNGITKSELLWQSPDGSEVIGVMFANWYCNAMELPTDKEALAAKIENIVRGAERFAVTPELLGMNGCDHQPVQTDLTEAIRLANEVQDKVEVKQSNFKDYIEKIRAYKGDLVPYRGEIAGQLTTGNGLLINTASTRMDIKQENQRVQNLLERIAEPLNAYTYANGDDYDTDYYLYAWRILMQNHPHDSICSCSHDAIYDEMMTRFAKSGYTAQALRDEAADYLAANVNTENGAERNIIVFSAEAGCGSITVDTKVDFPWDTIPDEPKIGCIHIEDMEGNVIPADIRHLGKTFTYTLPDDRFRQPTHVNRFAVKFELPADGIVGTRCFRAVPGPAHPGFAPRKSTVTYADRVLENENLSVVFADNGSFIVTEKKSGITVGPCNIFEDVRDGGNTYNFGPVDGDTPILTADAKADFTVQTGAYSVTVTATMKTERCDIRTEISLSKDSDRVRIRTTLDNHTGNHRVRALFENSVETDVVYAAGQFDLVERNITPWENWTCPYNTQRAEQFVMLKDKNSGSGFITAHKGLNEYEILRDSKNTMALTLLRCTGEIGDWGDFPTPKAQCIGTYTLEYCVIPFTADTWENAVSSAYVYCSDAVTAIDTDKHTGSIPAERTFIQLDDPMVRMSACKCAEDGNGIILRLYNVSDDFREIHVYFDDAVLDVRAARMDETTGDQAVFEDDRMLMTIGPKQIVTLRLYV
ncbi:MAG: alpha-mannosidase [Clostridia bacterium]|nr:alpha-mannosidase [Clostridia bacterium]